MAAKKSAPKRTSVKHARKKSVTSKNFLMGSRVWLFILAFALVGTALLISSLAKTDLPAYSDDIVAGYIDLNPTVISKDKKGNLAYEMYSKSTYVLRDGTLVCDSGTSDTTLVSTGTLSKNDVEKLHQDVTATGVTSLADEISVGAKPTFVDFEGFVVGGPDDTKGTAVYAGAQKPAQFAKAQEKLLSLCTKATRQVERSQIKQPRAPKLKNTKKTALSSVQELLVPKASACCNVGTRDTTFENTNATAINDYRASKGVAKLTRASCLNSLAVSWTQKMANAGAISHNPNLANELTYACSRYWQKGGENVGVGYDSAGLMQAFMNSAAHNTNLLDTAWNYMGVGGIKLADGRIYVTQLFARW
jgi:uncharacterized protein YkwD